ncbi:MAG: NAD(P)H-hydrate dehydratase [Novosphingobium sp.]
MSRRWSRAWQPAVRAVLAGIFAGLLARGQDLFEATAWAIWLHGEAGRRLAEDMDPLGFLARQLASRIPGLMRGMN